MAVKKTKKQIHAERHSPKQLPRTTLNYSRMVSQHMRAVTGDPTVCTLQDAGGLVIGLPCPSFAFEWLVSNNVIPLERLLQIYGPTGIGKSGLAFEIMRLLRGYSGIGTFMEHETKWNPAWASSIIGWGDELAALSVINCHSINQWQENTQRVTQYVKDKLMTGTKKEPGAGRTFPYLIIIDSLMAKLMQESQDKIQREGSAGGGHPREALSITRWLQTFPQQLEGWPIMLVTVNHEKLKKDDAGNEISSRAGGQHVNFQGSFELALKRLRFISTAQYDGHVLQISCGKNSYGPDSFDGVRRAIRVNVVWWDEIVEVDGQKMSRQQTRFDWYGATIDLIMRNCAFKPSARWTRAREICGLQAGGAAGGSGSKPARGKGNQPLATKVWSRKLGISKDEPCNYSAAGQLIQQNPEIMQELRLLFGINMRKVFQPGVEYSQQKLTLKKEVLGGQKTKLGGSSAADGPRPAADE